MAPEMLTCKVRHSIVAWLRLAVIAYNVLTALKRLALPAELIDCTTEATAIFDFP